MRSETRSYRTNWITSTSSFCSSARCGCDLLLDSAPEASITTPQTWASRQSSVVILAQAISARTFLCPRGRRGVDVFSHLFRRQFVSPVSCRPAAAFALQRVVFQRRSLWMMQTRKVWQLLLCVKHATSQRRLGTWSIFLVVISSLAEIALTIVWMPCAHSAGWTSVMSWMVAHVHCPLCAGLAPNQGASVDGDSLPSLLKTAVLSCGFSFCPLISLAWTAEHERDIPPYSTKSRSPLPDVQRDFWNLQEAQIIHLYSGHFQCLNPDSAVARAISLKRAVVFTFQQM